MSSLETLLEIVPILMFIIGIPCIVRVILGIWDIYLGIVNKIKTGSFKEVMSQVWVGCVTDIDKSTFTVRLEDLTNLSNPEFIAVIPLEEMEANEISSLHIGATIIWIIKYKDDQGETRELLSEITVKRFPEWSKDDVEKAEMTASKVFPIKTGGH